VEAKKSLIEPRAFEAVKEDEVKYERFNDIKMAAKREAVHGVVQGYRSTSR
jgi:hypothetical protein